MRITTDLSGGFERTLTLTRPEAVCSTIQEWLADILSEPGVLNEPLPEDLGRP
jgi:hypothetical protein